MQVKDDISVNGSDSGASGAVVAVTGARGFVGAAACSALRAARARVIALGRASSHGKDGHVTAMGPDVAALAEALRPAQSVLHCVGAVGAAQDAAGRRALFEANQESVERLFDALACAGTSPRVVIVASAAVYEPDPAGRPISETARWRPAGVYGVSKAAGALAALARGRGYPGELAIAAPFNLLGPGQSPQMAPQTFLEQIAAQPGADPVRLRVGDLAAARDWTDVRDLAEALRLLARPGAAQGVYNVCSGVARSIGDLLDEIATILGREIRCETDAARLRPGEASRVVGDPSRLRRDFGWTPRRTLRESLTDMLKQSGMEAAAR